MDTLTEVSYFFKNSPKRQALLEEKIHEICPESRRVKLLDVCKTRWVQRLDVMEVYSEICEAVVDTLDTIRQNLDRTWNGENATKANGLFHACTNFQFIMAFVVAREGMAFTKGLTVKLQSVTQDIMNSYKEIETVKNTLQNIRDNIDAYHLVWYQQAISMAETLGVEAKKPRTVGRQAHRNNVPADTIEDYYRVALALPFIDHLLNEFKDRFFQGQQEIMEGFSGIPEVLLRSPHTWKPSFTRFCKLYNDDMPSPLMLPAELELWETYWKRCKADKEVIPSNLREVLPKVDRIMFPNIAVALQILGTIPVTTCQCERCVSALKRVKTPTRSTMSQDRLNGLTFMHTKYNMDIDMEAVINEFARRHPRKMQLVDILNGQLDK